MSVPCGSCPSCLSGKALQWAIRCHHEASQHKRNCFITLTYDDDHLPPDGKISKRELQLFWKRLRKKSPPVRYFACGEYGGQTHRPHYHALVFGADFLGGSEPVTDELYTHPVLVDSWGQGHVSVAELNMSTCCYVAGYATKKLGDPDTFCLMSRGLGHDWFDTYEDDIRRTGNVVIEGRAYPVPERYFDWSDMTDLKDYRKAMAAEKRQQKTPAQHVSANRSRAINAAQRLKLKQEKI